MNNVRALTLLFLVSCTRTDPLRKDTQPAPTDAPPALASAHQAYLAGDFVEMGERLKDVIVDPHAGELARENAFALLESAYDATHGRLPARATLPAAVKSIAFGVLDGATPYGPHRLVYLDLRVVAGRGAHVTDMRVTRLPNEPILGLVDKRGTFKIVPDEGVDDVKLELRNVDTLPDRGAFEIHIAFDDAPSIDAFILANKLVAHAQPEIASPDVAEVITDPHPEIVWHPYRSPEFAPWESRSVWLGVSREKDFSWGFYKWDPGELAQVRVEPALEPGSYWLDLMCAEERTFGAIRISRSGQSARPFRVAR